MSKIITTFDHWNEDLREKRGLLNGERVAMARELRGMARYVLARKIGIPAKEQAQREQGWHFWEDQEQDLLTKVTDFPIGFFTQDDPPVIGPVFMCGHDEEGNHWCSVEELR